MSREHHYQVGLSWYGREQGRPFTYESYSRAYFVQIEGKPMLKGSADPMFRGDPSLHNPEEMLVVVLSSCHMLSFLAEAARVGLEVLDYSDQAQGP